MARYDGRVNDESPESDDALRLRRLLDEGGYRSAPVDATRRIVMFAGRTRDWTFSLALSNGWFSIVTYVCEIPEASGVRAGLFDLAMTANHSMSLCKFVKGHGLVMELEYRDEHVSIDVVRNLVALALANLEEWYPKIFRVVSGDAVLATIAPATLPTPDLRQSP